MKPKPHHCQTALRPPPRTCMHCTHARVYAGAPAWRRSPPRPSSCAQPGGGVTPAMWPTGIRCASPACMQEVALPAGRPPSAVCPGQHEGGRPQGGGGQGLAALCQAMLGCDGGQTPAPLPQTHTPRHEPASRQGQRCMHCVHYSTHTSGWLHAQRPCTVPAPTCASARSSPCRRAPRGGGACGVVDRCR